MSEHTNLMPPEIAKAIIAVKKQVKQLGTNDRNDHGKYAYVSVDKFYDRIGKMMAEAGLALLIDETESEVKEGKSGSPWLFTQYNLSFMHETGVVSESLRRSLAMPITGPQTYGSAQSYIEKQFLRQVFKIPTGEKDADDMAQDEGNAPPPRPQTNGATRTAAAPPPPEKPAHLNGNGAKPLPAHPEESGEVTAARQRVQMLVSRIATMIETAPSDHVLDVSMDDARDELKEIEAVRDRVFKFKGGEMLDGVQAAQRLRARHNTRIAELRGGQAA